MLSTHYALKAQMSIVNPKSKFSVQSWCLAHTHTRTHMYTHTHTLPLSHTHIHALSLSHAHTNSLSLSQTHTQTPSLSLKHTHTLSHTLLLSLLHKRTHTHTNSPLSLSLSHSNTHKLPLSLLHKHTDTHSHTHRIPLSLSNTHTHTPSIPLTQRHTHKLPLSLLHKCRHIDFLSKNCSSHLLFWTKCQFDWLIFLLLQFLRNKGFKKKKWQLRSIFGYFSTNSFNILQKVWDYHQLMPLMLILFHPNSVR